VEPVIGQISMFTCTSIPPGWLFCVGQIVEVKKYVNLFSVIGDYYGGDGAVYFALPNLQERFPLHAGANNRLGDMGGAAEVTLTPGQLPSHTHNLRAVQDHGDADSPAGNHLAITMASGGGESKTYHTGSEQRCQLNAETVGTSGLGQAHYNMPPFLYLAFCIAYEGAYPQRT
jgi:microcystin-dependent protein